MPEISNIFKPNEKQLKFLEGLLNPEVEASVVAICRYSGIAPSTYYRAWRKKPEFCEWLKNEYEKGCRDLIPHLGKIAWNLAKRDFRFFEFLQRKYGGSLGQIESGLSSLWEIIHGAKEESEAAPGA